MQPILEIQNISKKFRIQHEKRSYLSLRESLTSLFKKSTSTTEEFYALNDISFNIDEGDSIGIIGKNGAGKSTLLKILSKITPPTSGKIISRGRIASLLEVGTGFHLELSGRENIFLNGSILGMKRKEIQNKFDEIVEFSGVEKFLDTPLKHYSSGMQLRLAFSVAAFLEPEILIIDEVLAVGDAEFQKKCMGKMEQVSTKEGKTILFVSHNMGSMRTLCKKGVLLGNGELKYSGSMAQTIEKYLDAVSKASILGDIPNNVSTYNTGIIKLKKIILLKGDGNSVDYVNYLSPIYLYFELYSLSNVQDLFIDIRINTFDGIELAHAMNKYTSPQNTSLLEGKNTISCKLSNCLQPGKYNLTIGFHNNLGTTMEYVENILSFTVLTISDGNNSDFNYPFQVGYVRLESEWEINKI